MKLLIEEYQYDLDDVREALDGLFTLPDVEQKVSVNHVGYYLNPHEAVRDMVFILPKVLIDDSGLVFGKYRPRDIIDLDEPKVEVDAEHRRFLYEFAVWIHRAIVVYNASHPANGIVLHRQIESEGRGSYRKKSNTLLDVILALLRFNREHRQFFTFILKNIHSGHNKINWGKTIARTQAVVQDGSPAYLDPVNKKRQVNFDEELIIIYFSILNHIHAAYGFRAEIDFGFKLITGRAFERYLGGYGRTRLRQIKYKYFSDTAVKLWDLCYAFFDKAHRIRVDVSKSEYLLVKSFHIVFEAMIDELIGDRDIPKGLKEQDDGKLVDHFYTYEGLLINRDDVDNDIYYIGDSKYYRIGNSVGKESVYKQRTYARNVIQWNLDLWNSPDRERTNRFEKIRIFDDETEGYNVIPNFFISAAVDTANLKYDTDGLTEHPSDYDLSFQIKNRLYDRDTLLLSHYDVNFLFVLALYARDSAPAKAAWRETVRAKFRKAVQKTLRDKFDFYALAPHPDVDAAAYFKAHFQDTLGKTFRPYEDRGIFSLALDKRYPDENETIRTRLAANFYLVPVELGQDPSGRLADERQKIGSPESPDSVGKFLFGIVNKTDDRGAVSKEYEAFARHEATLYVMRNMPSGDITAVRFFIPMYDGGIDGYYDILGITFGSRKQDFTDDDGNIVRVSMPCLNIRLGQYHPLGPHRAEVPKYRNWNGQIHTRPEVLRLYAKGD